VDYWDYLGWKDPFAAKAYTERQHNYAGIWQSRSVYTPEFVLNGKEWRGWSRGSGLSDHPQNKIGVLTARSEDRQRWVLRFRPVEPNPSSNYDFYAALLGFDLVSDVKAGENRGRKLEHDFVVIAFAKCASKKDGDFLQGELSLTKKPTLVPKRLAYAAWVSSSKRLEPIQALGGWLDSPKRVP
jgi:hypothetical protein